LSQQPGNNVRLSYRKKAFSRVKAGNRERLEEAIASGAVSFLPDTNLTEIATDHVKYAESTSGVQQIDNDYVFVMIGGTLPTEMLKELGIEIDTKFGEPLTN
jgi:thioredoxin reductase